MSMNSQNPTQPPGAPARLPDPTNTLIILGGERHAWAEGREWRHRDYQTLCGVLAEGRYQGFRDLALELPRDWEPFVQTWLAEVEELWRQPSERIANDMVDKWVDTLREMEKKGLYIRGLSGSEEEIGDILSQVAELNAEDPKRRIRVHCVDVPSEEWRKAIREGELFIGIALPQSCQGEIESYLAQGEAVAHAGRCPSCKDEKKLGEALLAKLQATNPSYGRDPEERRAFREQVKILCEGSGREPGLKDLAMAWAVYPKEKRQVRTLPMTDELYWDELRKWKRPAANLLPTSELTARSCDYRTREMASRMAAVAQSVLQKEPVCQMIGWFGKGHVDPKVERISPFDPQPLQAKLGSELAGKADTRIYVCGRVDDPKREILESILYEKGEEFQSKLQGRERAKERGNEPPRGPSTQKAAAGRASMLPVPVSPRTLREFRARSEAMMAALKGAKGKAITPEAWAEALRQKPARELTPGQQLFLSVLRERKVRENDFDLSQQPIGVLRRAAEATVAQASASLQKSSYEPPSRREMVPAQPDPERRERIRERMAKMMGQFSLLSADDRQKGKADRREWRAFAEGLMDRIPEIKHPGEISREALTRADSGRSSGTIDRSPLTDREGR